jgi:cytochrome P450
MGALIRPPGPRSRSIGGSFGPFRADPLTFLQRCAAEFGDISYFRAAHQHMYFVNTPALVQETLVTQSGKFIKSRILQRAKALLGEGLLTNEGASHLRQRRLVQPAFHRDRLIRYADDMTTLAVRARERWRAGETIDIDREMMRLTLGIVGRTLFSAEVDEDAETVGEAMNALIEMMPLLMFPGSQLLLRMPLPFLRRFQRAGEKLDATIYRIIDERRRSGADTGDLLSMLLLARDTEGDQTGMTDKQVRDETLTLFIAGHETTATALTWAWYLLAQHPEAEARMHAEIDRELGGRPPGFDDVPQLPIRNTFSPRRCGFTRQPGRSAGWRVEELEFGGYTVPKKSIVIMSPYVMHREPEYWPEPDRFDPGTLGTAISASATFLLPVRRRSAAVHRRKVRVDGGDAGAGRDSAAVAFPAVRVMSPVERKALITLRPKNGIKAIGRSVAGAALACREELIAFPPRRHGRGIGDGRGRWSTRIGPSAPGPAMSHFSLYSSLGWW